MKAFIDKYNYPLILLLVCFLLYGNTLKNDYGLDDEFVTGPKSHAKAGFKGIPKIFKSFHVNDESGNTYEYRPITKVTFAIEYQFFGENIKISHLVNLLLYFTCLMVLFKFLNTLFNEYNRFILFSIVLVFALLPVHAEVVASLKNRDVLLSFIFSFLGFRYVLKYLDTEKIVFIALALLFMILAFFSKFDVLPMLIIIPLTAFQRKKISVKQIAMIVALFIISYLVFGFAKRGLLDKSQTQKIRIYQYFENPLYFNSTFWDKISAAFNSVGFYVKMLLFPNKMACYYGYNVLPLYSFVSLYALAGMSVIGFLVYNFYNRFKKPDLMWFGILFFSASISMYSNFVTPAVGVVADRFLFFASVGFAFIAAYYFYMNPKSLNCKSYRDLTFMQKSIAVIFILSSFYFVYNRNKEWKNKLTLFEADVRKYPESVKLSLLTSAQVITHLNDGSNEIKENDKLNKIRMSEKLLANAIKTDSSCAGCYNNMAFLFLSFERDPASALPYLLLGYRRDSTKKELACNIGIALFRLNKIEEAKPYLFKAIELDKKHDFSVPYEVLQDLFSKTNPNEGIRFFSKEKEDGNMPELMNVLMGKTYFEAKDTLNSIRFYKEALRINPNNKPVADFVSNLEVKYYKKAM